MRHTNARLYRVPRPDHVRAVSLLTLSALTMGLIFPRAFGFLAHPQGANSSVEKASRRMLVLCDAYQGPCRMETSPNFFGDTVRMGPSQLYRRHIWQGFVHANGQVLGLIENDKTGDLICAFNGGDAAPTAVDRPASASVETATQAARLSIRAIRKLQMIPAEAEVAIVGKPVINETRNTWRVTWQVRDRSTSDPYRVRVLLQQRDGHLLYAANGKCSALGEQLTDRMRR